MPGTLTRYILRLFAQRVLMVLAGLSAVLLVFDVLANIDDVLAHTDAILVPVLAYAGLRLPEVVSLVVPLTVLLAAMAVFAQLVACQEMVAMRAAGVSIYRVAGALLLGAVALAAAHLWFANAVLPHTSSRLQLWAAQDYRGLPPRRAPRRAPTWFAVSDSLVKVGYSSLDGRRLYDVTVVRRDEAGRMVDYFRARRAFYDSKLWVFAEVRRPAMGGREASELDKLRVALPVTPKRFAALAGRPTALRVEELWRLARDPDTGGRPTYVYESWLQRKLAHPLGALVMVLIAAPLGLQLARRNRMLLASFAAIGAGFLFFVAERLLLALGETGLLPPWLAVWTPAVVFSILSLWVLVSLEG